MEIHAGAVVSGGPVRDVEVVPWAPRPPACAAAVGVGRGKSEVEGLSVCVPLAPRAMTTDTRTESSVTIEGYAGCVFMAPRPVAQDGGTHVPRAGMEPRPFGVRLSRRRRAWGGVCRAVCPRRRAVPSRLAHGWRSARPSGLPRPSVPFRAVRRSCCRGVPAKYPRAN